jgi:hypothetical protein
MLSELFKKLRKTKLFGWHRAGLEMPMAWDGGRTRRWVDEELNNLHFRSFSNEWQIYGNATATETVTAKPGQMTDERKAAKPAEVFKELTADKPNLDLTNLDQKIKAIKKRIDFMVDELGAAAAEEKNVLSWLEARKKGIKTKVMAEFVWPVTTTEKLADLLKKYKLSKTTFNQYSLSVPAEAIDEMEKYSKLCDKVTKDDPEFILIVPDTPEEKVKHRDPIVLATSPFGKFLHVLGAWDKEVEIMHELYFEMK